MTLKEELEILRGEPIEVFNGDPMDIPCIETSDTEKLCKHPVVSVHMITYNHEPYIRQAIEGVMMQKTNFEFELVIGEDCSQDKTREICFEYQQKYPGKIRVLWWHENVTKFGGNGLRVTVHCRGEFIAFCEGDDYWTDPLKLQKQVEVMRAHSNVGLVFTNAQVYDQKSKAMMDWDGASFYSKGVIPGKDFFNTYCYGKDRKKGPGPECFIMTASCFIRTKLFNDLINRYEIFRWIFTLGDKQLWVGLSTLGDVFYIEDKTAVYRRNSGGSTNNYGARIFRDSALVKIYFSIKGPHDSRIPFSILTTAFSLSMSAVDSKGLSRKINERIVLLKILRKYKFDYFCLSVKSIIRWIMYFVFGRRSVFTMTKRSFFGLSQEKRR